MTFRDALICSRIFTFIQIADRLFLCSKNKYHRHAYFYLSVMFLKDFNVGSPDLRIPNWKYAIKAYKCTKHPDESLKIKTKHPA